MEPDPPEGHLTVEYEIREGESVSRAALQAVSSLKGCDPCELTPLYWTIDPELLDELCASQQEGTVKFVYDGFHITVENSEYLLLRPTA